MALEKLIRIQNQTRSESIYKGTHLSRIFPFKLHNAALSKENK